MTLKTTDSEIRKSYLLNKYVIIAPKRASRPNNQNEEQILKLGLSCPFCPENIEANNICDQITVNKKWRVVSIKNIFSALSLDNEKAYGTQEVVIENQNHFLGMADFNHRQLKNVLKMYANRTKEISKNKKINYILCFKNQGPKAGASIIHSHSQIFASEILPPDIQEEMFQSEKYTKEHKICPYCNIIKKEMGGSRKIWENDLVAAFTPYASEFHYEAWIFTKRHVDNITQINDLEMDSLCSVLKKILIKLKKLNLSFNLFLHQVVLNQNQHFYIKIQPRDSIWAGVELGSGLIINTVAPEMAAQYYRK